MANPSKRRGSAFERDFVSWLREQGWPDAERRVSEGINDRGDVAGVKGWTLELKATKHADLGTAMGETEREAKKAGTLRYALVKKRRNKSCDEAFVILPAWLWAEMVRES